MSRARSSPLGRTLVPWLAVALFRLGGLLPLPVARYLAKGLGRITFRIVPRLKRVGLANLDLAYGDAVSRREKLRILRAAMDNLAIVAAEFPHTPRLAQRQFEGHVWVEGAEHYDATSGAVIVGGHLGNWEWMAPACANLGFPIGEVVRPLDHPSLDRYIDGIRTAAGVHTIPKSEAGRNVVCLLRRGWMMGVLADQSPRDAALPVQFFAAPCWATTAPVMCALRARVPLHLVSMFRHPSGRYVLQLYPPLEMERTGDLRRDLYANTQRCQSALEGLVRQHPEQWLWFHRRWKERPRLEKQWERRKQTMALEARRER